MLAEGRLAAIANMAVTRQNTPMENLAAQKDPNYVRSETLQVKANDRMEPRRAFRLHWPKKGFTLFSLGSLLSFVRDGCANRCLF